MATKKAGKLFVKVAHPRAQFYQEVQDPETGEWIAEHVIAMTDENGRQVPIPFEITATAEAKRALNEKIPDTDYPATLVEASDDEIADAKAPHLHRIEQWHLARGKTAQEAEKAARADVLRHSKEAAQQAAHAERVARAARGEPEPEKPEKGGQ
jgi:hypothetical protein